MNPEEDNLLPQGGGQPDPLKSGAALDRHKLLSKYNVLGESNPKFQELKKACKDGKDDDIRRLIPELEDIVKQRKVAKPASKFKFPLWSMLCVIVSTAGICGLMLNLCNVQIKQVIASKPKGPLVQYVGSEALGGQPSRELAEDIVLKMGAIKPDNVMFIGHRLLEKNIVKYLSAISRSARVRILLGCDANGKNALDDAQSPLRQFYFTQLIADKRYVPSQVLIVLNSQTKTGFAIFGTYPFDITEASTGNPEYNALFLNDYDECLKLYQRYAVLFPSK